MKGKKINITSLTSDNGCFDLQFRKDTRHERINSPTYYRWKAQFIITCPKFEAKIMEKVKKELGCGKIHIIKNQARFSVQKIDEITKYIIPFFKKNPLSGNKKKDFELWNKAVGIIHQNKGKYIGQWKKSDLFSLLEIQKSKTKYKIFSREPKWVDMAQTIAKSI